MKRLYGILAIALLTAGCTTVDQILPNTSPPAEHKSNFSRYEQNYLFQPSAIQLGDAKPTGITDAHILEFSENVKQALRRRMNRARLARMFSGTIQVLSAATAAGLGAVSANINTITALAGTSAVMPQLQDLFEARERALHYEQGARMIEEAQGRYLRAMATGAVNPAETKADNERASERISLAAVDLFDQTVASLGIVQKALVDLLPTVEELQKASGTYADLHFVPEKLTLSVGGEADVLVSGTAVISAVVVTDQSKASSSVNGRVIKLRGLAAGDTSLVVTDVAGRSFPMSVKVEPAPAWLLSPNEEIFEVKVGSNRLISSDMVMKKVIVADEDSLTAAIEQPTVLRLRGRAPNQDTHLILVDTLGRTKPVRIRIVPATPATPPGN